MPEDLSTLPMTRAPDGIVRAHTQPRQGLVRHASPLSILVLGAIMALGMSGLVGHAGMDTTRYRGDTAPHVLDVEMPEVIRTGDFFETRLHVKAGADIAKLRLAVPIDLWREVTVNAMVPQPESESADGEAYVFDFGPLSSGKEMRIKISAQVNPRLHGRVEGNLELRDGDRLLVSAPRRMRVLP